MRSSVLLYLSMTENSQDITLDIVEVERSWSWVSGHCTKVYGLNVRPLLYLSSHCLKRIKWALSVYDCSIMFGSGAKLHAFSLAICLKWLCVRGIKIDSWAKFTLTLYRCFIVTRWRKNMDFEVGILVHNPLIVYLTVVIRITSKLKLRLDGGRSILRCTRSIKQDSKWKACQACQPRVIDFFLQVRISFFWQLFLWFPPFLYLQC